MTPELKSGMIIRTQDNNLHLILGNTAIILGIATGGGIRLNHLSFDMSKGPTYNVVCVYSEPTSHLAACMNWWIRDEHLLTHTNSELIWQYKESEQFKYPLYRKRSISDKHIVVQFTGLQEGMVMESDVDRFPAGYTSITWRPHTDKSWEEVQIILEPEEEFSLEDIFEAMGIKVFVIEE